jgi:Rod binding domain-containing protein
MSTISNTGTNSTIDLLTRQSLDRSKQAPKYIDPLRAANPNPLSVATKPDSEGEESNQSRARAAAEGLVSTTFIEPILKQLRESNNTPPPFGPSSAEKQFSTMLDTKLSDEIVRAANFPLVTRIAAQLMENMPSQNPPRQSLDING